MTENLLSSEHILSPIKISPLSFTFPGKESEEKENFHSKLATELSDSNMRNEILVHPHPLQAKHEARRNTFQQTQGQITPINLAKRPALTSPRALPGVNHSSTGYTSTGSPSHRVTKKRLSKVSKFSINRYLKDVSEISSRDEDATAIQITRHQHTSPPPLTNEDVPNSIMQKDSYNCFDIEGLQRENGSHPIAAQSHMTEQQTSDLLLSPKSRPVFSSAYVMSIQQKHTTAMERLEGTISTKNSMLCQLKLKLNEAERNVALLEHQLEVLDRKLSDLEITNETLVLRSAQLDSDLMHAARVIKQRESSISELEDKLEATQREFQKLEEESSEELKALEQLLATCQAQFSLIEERAREEASESKAQLEGEKLVVIDLKNELTTLSCEKDSLREETDRLIDTKNELSVRIQKLEKDAIANEAAKSSLAEHLTELRREALKLQDEVYHLETFRNDLEGKLNQTTDRLRDCEIELEASGSEIEKLRHEILGTKELATRCEFLELELSRLTDEAHTLRSESDEKDRIISGDTKKLSQLVEELDNQKQLLSQLKTESIPRADAQDTHMLQQIIDLKHQVSSAQQKTDERIQEVAEQLFHQYSKKHETKVNQLREKYEIKLEEKNKQIALRTRQLESMESRLKTGEKEKNYLLKVLEKADNSGQKDPRHMIGE